MVKYLAILDTGGGGEQPLVAPSVTAKGSYSKGALEPWFPLEEGSKGHKWRLWRHNARTGGAS